MTAAHYTWLNERGKRERGRERERKWRGKNNDDCVFVLSPELFDYCLMLGDKPWIVFDLQCARLIVSFGNKTTWLTKRVSVVPSGFLIVIDSAPLWLIWLWTKVGMEVLVTVAVGRTAGIAAEAYCSSPKCVRLACISQLLTAAAANCRVQINIDSPLWLCWMRWLCLWL